MRIIFSVSLGRARPVGTTVIGGDCTAGAGRTGGAVLMGPRVVVLVGSVAGSTAGSGGET